MASRSTASSLFIIPLAAAIALVVVVESPSTRNARIVRTAATTEAIVDGMTSSRLSVLTPRVLVGPRGMPGSHSGSGVPLGQGRILTAYHVVQDANDVVVGIDAENVVPARVVWRAIGSDLVMLHAPLFKSAGLPIRCDNGRVGERVVSMGYPLDLGYAETNGRIVGRPTPRYEVRTPSLSLTYHSGVQWMDAPIGPGMSGGPTIDESGHLIGVNVLLFGSFGGIVPASEICLALGRS